MSPHILINMIGFVRLVYLLTLFGLKVLDFLKLILLIRLIFDLSRILLRASHYIDGIMTLQVD